MRKRERLQREKLLRGEPLKPDMRLEKLEKLSPDVWIYYLGGKHSKSSHIFWIVFPVLWTLIVLFCFIFVSEGGLWFLHFFLIVVTIFIFAISVFNLSLMEIEIDRNRGTLKKKRPYLPFKRREDIVLLSTFNTVTLKFKKERDPHVSGDFSIYLTGPNSKELNMHSDVREWFSSDPNTALVLKLGVQNEYTEYEAKRYAAELANFLNFRFADRTLLLDVMESLDS